MEEAFSAERGGYLGQYSAFAWFFGATPQGTGDWNPIMGNTKIQDGVLKNEPMNIVRARSTNAMRSRNLWKVNLTK